MTSFGHLPPPPPVPATFSDAQESKASVQPHRSVRLMKAADVQGREKKGDSSDGEIVGADIPTNDVSSVEGLAILEEALALQEKELRKVLLLEKKEEACEEGEARAEGKREVQDGRKGKV